MNETERALLCQAIHQLPYPPLFATVSGAHLYGFPSPDSDFDLRGVYVLPLTSVIGLGQPKETVTRTLQQAGRQVDLVAHDIKKFLTLLLNKNGYVLEQLYSPLVVHGGAAFEELQALARGCITRHVYHHYHGFARHQIERFEAESPHRVKTLLYIYRVLLTGILLLETGQVEANLLRLNETFHLAFIPDLIAQKQQEGAMLDEADPSASLRACSFTPFRTSSELVEGAGLAMHQATIARLLERLETAFQESPLPERPTNRPALNDFLVRVRLEAGDEGL